MFIFFLFTIGIELQITNYELRMYSNRIDYQRDLLIREIRGLYFNISEKKSICI
jgi:hypothetical protein